MYYPSPQTLFAPPFRSLLFSLFIILLAAGCTSNINSEQEIREVDPDQAAEEADRISAAITAEVNEDMELSLWASEKLITDPVGLDIDHKGRLWITNTNRSWSSEFDIRDHPEWMNEEMTFTSVDDKKEFLHRVLSPKKSDQNSWLPDRNDDGSHDWKDLTVEKEKIFQVLDRNNDGVADQSKLFIKDFNTEISDVLGGILYFDGNIYAGVAPDMWKLQDTNGDGLADKKESLMHGFGVHIGFSGHGMSGATYGPDGRIYWAMGEIGFNGEDEEGKQWYYPNQGVIVRSEPDGSNFEVFARGLRNIFEFDFDKFGNLITVDNDGDYPGEDERLVYLVKGSDSGWRHNWQYGKYDEPNNNDYNVWMDEGMDIPRHEGQAAYFIPPLSNYHNGPSGFVYNPGTALSEKWKDHFLVAEFTGSTASSRIHAFTLKQDGAGFTLDTDQTIEQGILATSMDFGPDGALYFADWIEGWKTKDKGRIWKLDTPATAHSPLREETKQILGEDFSPLEADSLLQLLHHPDMRVREKAQFELADRDQNGASTLEEAIKQTDHRIARLHGIWGIGQLARKNQHYAKPLVNFLEDDDPRVRAQTAKVLGDVHYKPAAEELLQLLEDTKARPRFFAAQALGELAYEPATGPIIDMLAANDGEDVYLRHAGTLALAQIDQPAPLLDLEDHPSRALRIAAVVALRRMAHPGVARFLDDQDEYVAAEAARAINDDFSIEKALPELAEALEKTEFTNEPFVRRAINANLRIGGEDAAGRLAHYAATDEKPDSMRVEALATLSVWSNPPHLDRVTGRNRGEMDLEPDNARQALASVLEPLLSDVNPQLRRTTIEAIRHLNLRSAADKVFAHLQDDSSADVRIAALQALKNMAYDDIEETIRTALEDQSSQVRMKALSLTPTLDLTDQKTADLLASVLGQGSREEQQVALETLGGLQTEPANKVLLQQLDQLIDGTYPGELQLDLIMAAKATNADSLVSKLDKYEQAKPSDEVVEANPELLYGGHKEAGKQLVFHHDAAQCMRCHTMGGDGSSVGPDLQHIGSTLSRKQILEALLAPDARIAPGYGTITVTLAGDSTVSGIVEEETDLQLTLRSSDDQTHQIPKKDITQQQTAPSSMPPMGDILTEREVRDIVAFLSSKN